MAVALGQVYFLPGASSDTFIVVGLGGGTAPVLLNARTGAIDAVDEASLTGLTVFTLFTGGANPSPPKYPTPSIVKVIGSTVPFYIVEVGGGSSGGNPASINCYLGYWMAPGSSATGKGSQFPTALYSSIVAEALIQQVIG